MHRPAGHPPILGSSTVAPSYPTPSPGPPGPPLLGLTTGRMNPFWRALRSSWENTLMDWPLHGVGGMRIRWVVW
jgi:hypothetical protein